MRPDTPGWRILAVLGLFAITSLLATDTVTIRSGETLSALAVRHGVGIAELVEWNDLDDPDLIYAGDSLIVSAPPPETRSYTVVSGDTLSAIALRVGTSVGRLAAANGLTDPDRLIAGQVLDIAVDTAAAEATPTPAATPAPSAPPTTTTVPTVPTVTTTTTVPTATVPTSPSTTTTARSGGVLLTSLFAQWSEAYNAPRDLLEAIAWHESGWRPDSVGSDGHLGITQLSPETVDFVEAGLIGREMDPLDPSDGLQMAARYLRYILDRTHDEREAVAAWVQGVRSVQADGVSTAGGAYADAVLEIRRQRS